MNFYWYITIGVVISGCAFFVISKNISKLNKRIKEQKEEMEKNPITNPYRALVEMLEEDSAKDQKPNKSKDK